MTCINNDKIEEQVLMAGNEPVISRNEPGSIPVFEVASMAEHICHRRGSSVTSLRSFYCYPLFSNFNRICPSYAHPHAAPPCCTTLSHTCTTPSESLMYTILKPSEYLWHAFTLNHYHRQVSCPTSQNLTMHYM